MSSETSIVFKCDRCAAVFARSADRNIAEEELPGEWRRVKLDGNENAFARETWELCRDCVDELIEWFKRPPAGEWPADARRFARFFLELPFEMRRRFIEAQGWRITTEPKEK